MSARILDFKWQQNGQRLVDFADVEFTTGWALLGVVIVRDKDGGLVALPPGRPQIDQFGKTRRKANGKTEYAAIVKFRSKEVRENWSRQIVEALKASHGGMLQ
jgi:hypothetical protein